MFGDTGEDVAMDMKRKTYAAEHRREAARRVLDAGRPVVQAATELGFGPQVLGRWVGIVPASGNPMRDVLSANEWVELKRLRRELDSVHIDRSLFVRSRRFLRREKNPFNGSK